MTATHHTVTNSNTVADRRRAALERLHGDDRRSARPTRHTRRARRAPAERRPDAPVERLGPPPGTYYAIAGVVAVFVMLGLVMVLSASAVTEANQGHSPYRVFGRQAIWAALGLVGLVVLARAPYRIWRKMVVPLGFLAVAGMLAPFAPGIGASVNDARSWVRLGPFSVQPSEFLKLVVVIVAADFLTRRSGDLADRRGTLIPFGAIAAIGAGLCMAQGDLGSAIVLGGIVFGIGWVAGIPLTPLFGMASAALGGALLFVVSSPRRLDRFTAFMNVSEERDHLAYQTYQGFLSMASGGLSGSGIGGSNGKLGYLPYAHSDFIFAVIADELGMVGTIAVLGGFVALVWLGVQTALAAPDRFGMLLAGGIASWFGLQAIINVVLAVGLLLSVARRVNAR